MENEIKDEETISAPESEVVEAVDAVNEEESVDEAEAAPEVD